MELRSRCEELQKVLLSKEESLTRSPSHSQMPTPESQSFAVQTSGDVSFQSKVSEVTLTDFSSRLSESEQNAEESTSAERARERVSTLSHVIAFKKDAPAGGGRLHQLVSGAPFEILSCCMVFCNAITLAFDVQYNGHAVGHTLQFNWQHATTAEQQYPNGKVILEVLSWTFGIFFWIEVILRFCSSVRLFVRDPWSLFDAFVVVVWTICKLGDALPVDSSVLRLARLLRFLRLLKLARLVRAMENMDPLYTIITATRSCMDVLFWTFFAFGVVQLLLSLLLTQYLHSFYFDSADISADHIAVFTYYETFLSLSDSCRTCQQPLLCAGSGA
eukprot:TRINITY_DN73695_c0_g1_i1.p1 TRINITY_DN73695_c0_g1~~TRINITY_DN73695_c0_g1_i1.p1  ORF type:complete len:331 (+),score=29.43 TRINITY_DN73695_c0_g1_i1:264-1256(+)